MFESGRVWLPTTSFGGSTLPLWVNSSAAEMLPTLVVLSQKFATTEIRGWMRVSHVFATRTILELLDELATQDTGAF
jgi:hypothetical protein